MPVYVKITHVKLSAVKIYNSFSTNNLIEIEIKFSKPTSSFSTYKDTQPQPKALKTANQTVM